MKMAVQAMLLYLGSQNVETQYMGYLKTVTQYLEVSNKFVESTPSLGFYYEWCIHLSYVEVFQKKENSHGARFKFIIGHFSTKHPLKSEIIKLECYK